MLGRVCCLSWDLLWALKEEYNVAGQKRQEKASEDQTDHIGEKWSIIMGK